MANFRKLVFLLLNQMQRHI